VGETDAAGANTAGGGVAAPAAAAGSAIPGVAVGTGPADVLCDATAGVGTTAAIGASMICRVGEDGFCPVGD
jgi:hypothetical protein